MQKYYAQAWGYTRPFEETTKAHRCGSVGASVSLQMKKQSLIFHIHDDMDGNPSLVIRHNDKESSPEGTNFWSGTHEQLIAALKVDMDRRNAESIKARGL